jgi:hypothetical protein
MLKPSYCIFCFILVFTLKSCSDNKYTLYAKINSIDNDFNSADIFCNGLNLGKVDNSGAVAKLEFFNDVRVSKVDTFFLKQNPLGTKYIDIVKPNIAFIDNQFYKNFDTINVIIKHNQFFFDSNKTKKLKRLFINTLDSLDSIIK